MQPATKDGLRDQLRDRIASDLAWFLEPVLLDMLATVEDARWIVVLERDKGRGLKALVFSAAEHALKPIEPSRFVDSELDRLSAAVRGLVLRGQRLDASAIDTPSGIPALEARAADPSLGSAVAFVRRAGSRDFLRLSMSSLGGGRFTGGLPPLLAEDGAWDVEYYVEGRDAAARSRAWRATPPRRCASAGRRACRRRARQRPSRWYLWLALGVAAAGAARPASTSCTRSDDISVRLGAMRRRRAPSLRARSLLRARRRVQAAGTQIKLVFRPVASTAARMRLPFTQTTGVRQLPRVQRRQRDRVHQPLREGRRRLDEPVRPSRSSPSGQELFKLPPETPLPITIEGRRVFPAVDLRGRPIARTRRSSGARRS